MKRDEMAAEAVRGVFEGGVKRLDQLANELRNVAGRAAEVVEATKLEATKVRDLVLAGPELGPGVLPTAMLAGQLQVHFTRAERGGDHEGELQLFGLSDRARLSAVFMREALKPGRYVAVVYLQRIEEALST